jgi:hypothetical protein
MDWCLKVQVCAWAKYEQSIALNQPDIAQLFFSRLEPQVISLNGCVWNRG